MPIRPIYNGVNKLGAMRVALLYCVFATIWILASSYLVNFTVQDADTLARLELLKGLLFVFVTSGLLYLALRLSPARGSSQEALADLTKPARKAGIVILFIALTLVVPLIGFFIIKLHGPQVEKDALENLAIVAKFKSTQIERWMDQRTADSMVLAANSTEFVHAVGQVAKGNDPDERHSRYVLGKLQSLRINYQYSTLLLLDKDLALLLAEGDQTEVPEELAEVARRAIATGKVERTDLYKSENQIIHMDWIVPILNVGSGNQEVIAAVVLRTDPEQFLYPVIRVWPSASESAESMLVRRDGDDVLYLSDLQALSGTALSLRLPMTEGTLPAAVALNTDQPGRLRGIDYKKQDVLAAYHPVANTDWRIVSKISRDEVLVPLWQMILIVSSIAFIFVIAISFGLLALWRQQSRLQSLLTLAHKTKSERLLQQFFNMPFVGMAIISATDKKLTRFNDYLCELTGYSREELTGKSCLDFTHPDDIEADVREFNRILDGDSSGYVMEKRFFRKDGSMLIALVDTKCIRKPNGTVDYLYATAQDVTQQKAAEARIQRLTHLYAALSLCNQAIVRFTSEQALFDKVCETAVTYGGMKMAWIGMINDKTSMIEPVASHGDDIGYLENISVSSDGHNPYGQGPTGEAIRQNLPFWCQDYEAGPITAQWVERSHGAWGSSAAVPICRGGIVVGALNMYSAEKHAFDEDAKNLLIEMAMDISYALDNFDKEVRRQRAESQLMESESKFHLLFDQSLDGLLIMDGYEIIECNPAVMDMIGCSLEHILHTPVWAFSPARQPDGISSEEKIKEMIEIARLEGRHRFEWMHRRLNGEDFPAEVTMVAITLNGKQVFYTAWRDISEQKNAEARIRHLAQYDVLTSLPNRTLLTDRVNQAINMAQRNHQNLSVMFFDLDRFKNVNDSLGHGVGDELLIQVSLRLQSVVRDQDTVSRIGGDEFVLLLLDTNAEGASRVAEKLMSSIAQPYQINHHEITITPSIGIAVYPDDGESFDDLLKSADIAMYRAKQSGRNNYHFFTAKMQEDSVRIMQLTTALHYAIDLDQLSLHYQPQLSLSDESIVGVEALIRWQHPDFGWVSPAEFIPIAEDTGDILKIGEWVLQKSIRQLKQWQDDGLSLRNISVNLSAVQFRYPHLPELISKLLEDAGLPAECLELELTESASMDDPVAAIAMMDKLADLGVRMSIDDFGTGYSSLSYLKRFRVSKLKIDQSFVRDIMTDTDDRAIVNSIVSLSRSLGMKTIAEGVETAEQLDFLRTCDCDEIQGYYLSRPLTAVDLAVFYQNCHIQK